VAAKVLLVEDDPALLRVLARALSAAGYVVEAAENGRKALRLLDDFAPDLVITDIVMPDMEGIGLMLEIKRRPNAPKVIAMSGALRLRGDYLHWASHLGADETLAKPFQMSELLELAAKALRPPIIDKKRATG
jgi:DNA-binding response OmpR family regulator